MTAAGDRFVVHMDRESLNDFPEIGKYDVTVVIRELEPERVISWTDRGQEQAVASGTSTATGSSRERVRRHPW